MANLFTGLRSKISSLEKGEPLLYYKCQWENKTDDVSIGFLTYKWLHFLILVSFLIISLICNRFCERWPIYYTNWGLVLYIVQALLGIIIVTNVYCCIRKGKPPEISERFMELYGGLQSAAVVTAFGITLVFWCLVYDSILYEINTGALSSHIGNSIVMLIDLLIVAHPVKLVDIILPFCLALLYVVFTIIYFLCGGTEKNGDPYIYEIMDWRKSEVSFIYVLGLLLLLIIIYIFVWLLCVLRRSISHRLEAAHDG